MYSPKINEKQIKKLYRLRERMREQGQKITMTAMVAEAIEKYLNDNESQKNKGRTINQQNP